MAKKTRREKYNEIVGQFRQFGQLKSDITTQITGAENGVYSDDVMDVCIDNIVSELIKELKENHEKLLRDDPEYQEVVKYRNKLVAAKRDYDSASKIYKEKYEREFNSKIEEIDKLRREEWSKMRQLKDEFALWGSVLDDARAQNGENFEKKIKTLRDDTKYQDALTAKKNLARLKMKLMEALDDFEKELETNIEESGEDNESSAVEQKKKLRKVENAGETLSNLGIVTNKVEGIILPTSIDGKKIIKKNDSNDVHAIEEIDYPNKIRILFSRVFDELGFNGDDYNVVVGNENKNMVRKWSYIVVEIPSRNKTIIVNNSYGEATFLCNNVFKNKEYLSLSKEELLKKYPDVVTKLDFVDEDLWVESIKDWIIAENLMVHHDIDVVEPVEFEQVSDGGGLKRKKYISGLTTEEENDLFDKYRTGDIEARNKIFWAYENQINKWLDNAIKNVIKNVFKRNNYDYDFSDENMKEFYSEGVMVLLDGIQAFVEEGDSEKNFTNFIRNRFRSKMENFIYHELLVRDIDSQVDNKLSSVEPFENEGLHVKALSEKYEEIDPNDVVEDEEGEGEGSIEEESIDVQGGGEKTIEEGGIGEEIIEEKSIEEKNGDKKVKKHYFRKIPSDVRDDLYTPEEIESILHATLLEENPEELQIYESLKQELKKAILTLSEREQTVINSYFGLDGGVPKTLEEIGENLDLTKERVRQIKERAIRRLKHTSRSKELNKYL